MKITFVSNNATTEIDLSVCLNVDDMIKLIAKNLNFTESCISLVFKGRQLKLDDNIVSIGIVDSSKVIGVLRKVSITPKPQPVQVVPVVPVVPVSEPVPLPTMKPMLQQSDTPIPSNSIQPVHIVRSEPEPQSKPAAAPSESDEQYSQRMLSLDAYSSSLVNCARLPAQCDILMEIIRKQDTRLFDCIMNYPNILIDAIINAKNRVTQEPESSQQQIRLSADDVDAIHTLMGFGFSEDDCVMAYISCDKNADLAANYLFGN